MEIDTRKSSGLFVTLAMAISIGAAAPIASAEGEKAESASR
jgi:hypothetical protein